ncbi:MAG: GNAT family N-acetyltransferase [Planctomycetes bacterium]|nr:GNAT family N-acetyltransferase [Planctomycetota bacterium]
MYGQATPPAYRIHTPRLVLRCWDPRDAPLLKEAIDASLEHLLPWMPWAREEPQSVDMKVELLRQFRGRFDLDKDWVYGLFTRDEQAVVGGAGLHPVSSATPSTRRHERGVREIGYWVASAFAGQGFATEAASALVRVGFELDRAERIEIHCELDNVRSAAVARKLGFHEDGVLRDRLQRGDGELAPKQIFSMFASEYAESPCSRARCAAFDALGRTSLELPDEQRRGSGFR